MSKHFSKNSYNTYIYIFTGMFHENFESKVCIQSYLFHLNIPGEDQKNRVFFSEPLKLQLDLLGSKSLISSSPVTSGELFYKGLASRKVVRIYLRCHLRITYAATAPAYA